jgi:hypothetical protein
MVDQLQRENGAYGSEPLDSQHALDLRELIRLLKNVIKHLHPDVNGGAFGRQGDKEALAFATEALRMLEAASRQSRALAIRSDNPLVRFEESQEVAQIRREREARLAQDASDQKQKVGTEVRESTKGRYSPLRRILTSATGIFAASLAFSDSLGRNQFIAPLVSGPIAHALLVALIVSSGTLAIVVRVLQERAAALAERLVSVEAQQEIFNNYTIHFQDVEGEKQETVRFTKRAVIAAVEQISEHKLVLPKVVLKFARWIMKKTVHRKLQQDERQSLYADYRVREAIDRWTTFGRLSSLDAERIATVQLDDLLRRGIIWESTDKRIECAFIAEKTAFEDS